MAACFSRMPWRMLVLILLVALILLPGPVGADVSGPFYPASASSGDGLEAAWSSPGSVVSDDSAFATVILAPGAQSNALQARGFGFAIPDGSVIAGITVEIGRFASPDGAVVQDQAVRLVKAGTPQATNKAQPTGWPAAEATATYGGASDLWGSTWTAADLNAANFGVDLRASSGAAAGDASAAVDFVRVRVDYTYTAATTIVASPVSGTYGDTVTLSAVMTPALPGRTITFRLNNQSACSGSTGPDGTATCAALLRAKVGSYPSGVLASFAGAPGHAAASGTAALTVAKRPITVSAQPDSKVYDGTKLSAVVPVITSGSLAPGNTATWRQEFIDTDDDPTTGPEDVDLYGDPKTIVASGTISDGNSGANYQVTYLPAFGEITPLPIIIRVNDVYKFFGSPDPALTFTVEPGMIPPDVMSGTLVRAPGEALGAYEIPPTPLDPGPNYEIHEWYGGLLTILPKGGQVIIINTPAPAWARLGSSFTVAASASSGLPVTYSAVGACANAGAVFTIISTGTCTVRYTQPGNGDFTPAEPKEQRTLVKFFLYLPLARR